MNNFYQEIPVFRDFGGSIDPQNFVKVPKDWQIVITDVVMSTVAIQNGQYKSVNAVGAAVISAILNLDETLDLPFIFGGDGATLLIPSKLTDKTIEALQGVQNIAKNLSLDLRASIVPVSGIYDQKAILEIGRHQISSRYKQAVFGGNGFDLAEKMIKNPETRHLFEVTKNPQTVANIQGFSCRWQPILSRFGETISLIIKIKNPRQVEFYSQILAKITQIYGDSKDYHPINSQNLKLSISPSELQIEEKSFNTKSSISGRFGNIARLVFEGFYGTIFDKANLTMSLTDKKQNIIQSTDYRKFDGSLKMIMSGTSKQRLILTQFLDELYQNNKIFYGIHTSDSALLTCLVFEGTNKEMHFVDGNHGGYALAAKNLKAQIKLAN